MTDTPPVAVAGVVLPPPSIRLVDGNGLIMPAWRRVFQSFTGGDASAASLQSAIDQIAALSTEADAAKAETDAVSSTANAALETAGMAQMLALGFMDPNNNQPMQPPDTSDQVNLARIEVSMAQDTAEMASAAAIVASNAATYAQIIGLVGLAAT